MRLPFSKRRGLVSFEFLLVFSFILIVFLIIFSLEVFVIIRTTEAFGVWRVARVSSMMEDGWNSTVLTRNIGDLSINQEKAASNESSKTTDKKFGDVIADSLESAWNISFAKNSVLTLGDLPPVEVKIQYNSDTLKNFLKINSDIFYWRCPNKLKGVDEHQPDVFGK